MLAVFYTLQTLPWEGLRQISWWHWYFKQQLLLRVPSLAGSKITICLEAFSSSSSYHVRILWSAHANFALDCSFSNHTPLSRPARCHVHVMLDLDYKDRHVLDRDRNFGKCCCSTTAQTSASWVKKRYPWKIQRMDFSRFSCDSSESDPVIRLNREMMRPLRFSLSWLDFPMDWGSIVMARFSHRVRDRSVGQRLNKLQKMPRCYLIL